MEHRCLADIRLNFLSVLSTTAANPITKAEYAIKAGKARDFTLDEETTMTNVKIIRENMETIAAFCSHR
jgi:hypothetical protein